MRIECPECRTSYTLERLGLANPLPGLKGLFKCVTCGGMFDFNILVARDWLFRKVLRVDVRPSDTRLG